MHHVYKTVGTCSREISFDLEGDVVHHVVFVGGCPGNLKAIPKLVEGLTVSEIVDRVSGITCGYKNTSCADQMAKAILLAYEEEKQQ